MQIKDMELRENLETVKFHWSCNTINELGSFIDIFLTEFDCWEDRPQLLRSSYFYYDKSTLKNYNAT
jgi:hypothetical protein